MICLVLTNPTAVTIETPLVKNGMWPAWSYMSFTNDLEPINPELERIKALGAKVEASE